MILITNFDTIFLHCLFYLAIKLGRRCKKVKKKNCGNKSRQKNSIKIETVDFTSTLKDTFAGQPPSQLIYPKTAPVGDLSSKTMNYFLPSSTGGSTPVPIPVVYSQNELTPHSVSSNTMMPSFPGYRVPSIPTTLKNQMIMEPQTNLKPLQSHQDPTCMLYYWPTPQKSHLQFPPLANYNYNYSNCACITGSHFQHNIMHPNYNPGQKTEPPGSSTYILPMST